MNAQTSNNPAILDARAKPVPKIVGRNRGPADRDTNGGSGRFRRLAFKVKSQAACRRAGDALCVIIRLPHLVVFRLGAVRCLFAATRLAAASATRAHVTSSSGSSNSRSGARQKERSMVQPFFS